MDTATTLSAKHDPTEPELVARGAQGDTAAFAAIMRRHNRTLYRAARSILRSDAEAEDAVQDAYVRAYQALPRFRGDSSLGTWLTRIVVNEALQRLRRRRREGNVIPLEEAGDIGNDDAASVHSEASASDPEGASMREQLRVLLERRIDALPAAFRSVFVLRALEDMAIEEISACLDIPPATVRTRYFRARALLRERLERELDVASADAFGFGGARCDRIVQAVSARIRLPAPS